MKHSRIIRCLPALLVALFLSPLASAQDEELTATGKKLEATYGEQLASLKADLDRALEKFDAADKAAYLKAREAEAEARNKFELANQAIKGGVKKARSLVNHAKGKWIGGAEKKIREAEKMLKQAKNDKERRKWENELKKYQQSRQQGIEALAERQKALELAKKAEAEGPRLIEQATAALEKARENTTRVLKQTGLADVLMDRTLDAKLVKYVVITEATPQDLARFAQQSESHAALIDQLLDDEELMREMLVADGAERTKVGRAHTGPAQYGRAMEIYTDILKVSPAAKKPGVLHELAVACALEHSMPNTLEAPKADTDAPEHVDPVERYTAFEKAWLAGELDPAFKNFNAWELRHVVNGKEPVETLAWGRTMLRNFRPEHIRTVYGWRYVRIVATDVKYGSENVRYDRPELQRFQNIIMNGGVCGRRAFFGRFILRAFGIPTIARPSRGHAALAHWTPDGWVVNLGPGWGGGWTKTRYRNGRDFVATTQARRDPEAYLAVKRAQWFGDVAGEERVFGEHELKEEPGFWNAMSLHLQRRIITRSKARALEALGTHLGEADGSSDSGEPESDAQREAAKITTAADGTITIPATAFASKGGAVHPVRSYGEGTQVFMPRFDLKGTTILRGGTWKNEPDECDADCRLLSKNYGRYDNWGLRAAITPPAGKSDLPAELTLDLGDGVSMDFVLIEPGTFTMGGEQRKDRGWFAPNVPRHEVTITRSYYLGKYEVTQRQFEHVTGNNPSSKHHRDPEVPVDTVGEADAEGFCAAVAERTGIEVRLPTEAEWEYAARAGSDAPWFFGDSPSRLGDYAWYKDNAGGKPHPVGQKKPSPWGLYDIYGNVCERVADRYIHDFYKNGPKTDPLSTGRFKTSPATYEINAPKAGGHEFTALVCTVGYGQHLMVSVNGGDPVNIDLPYTSGEWQPSEPVRLDLESGKNTLEIYRVKAPQSGIAVKSYQLQP